MNKLSHICPYLLTQEYFVIYVCGSATDLERLWSETLQCGFKYKSWQDFAILLRYLQVCQVQKVFLLDLCFKSFSLFSICHFTPRLYLFCTDIHMFKHIFNFKPYLYLYIKFLNWMLALIPHKPWLLFKNIFFTTEWKHQSVLYEIIFNLRHLSMLDFFFKCDWSDKSVQMTEKSRKTALWSRLCKLQTLVMQWSVEHINNKSFKLYKNFQGKCFAPKLPECYKMVRKISEHLVVEKYGILK